MAAGAGEELQKELLSYLSRRTAYFGNYPFGLGKIVLAVTIYNLTKTSGIFG